MSNSPRLVAAALFCHAVLTVGDLMSAVPAAAQEQVDSGVPSNPISTRGRLEIQLLASRDQLTAGSTVGIMGTISNVGSDSTIYLSQASLTLTQPPELEGPLSSMRGWWAYFPNENQIGADGEYLHPDSVVIALVPGATAHVGWSPAPVNSFSDTTTFLKVIGQTIAQVTNELRFLFFSPGEYRIAVQAKYWTNPARPRLSYHATTQTMTVTVMAPQFVILLGAALGGLIAYIIFPSRRVQRVTQTSTTTDETRYTSVYRAAIAAQKKITPALGAMLWSAIVTILLARLADSQFLIRITVNDFWGAIAIGLVAQYAGSKWLERLLPAPNNDTKRDEETTEPAPVGVVRAVD